MKHIKLFESFSSEGYNELVTAMESSIRNPSDSKPILVTSSPGRGPTAMIGEIAKNMNFPMVYIDCETLTNINDFEDSLPYDPAGFIVFDEVNRASSEILNSIMKMASTRQYKSYTLPKGFIIVLISKGEAGDSNMGSIAPMNFSALENRFTAIHL